MDTIKLGKIYIFAFANKFTQKSKQKTPDKY